MIAKQTPFNESASSNQVEELSPTQQQRLTNILDDYLRGLEEGDPINVSIILRQNTDIAATLRNYLTKLNSLRGIAPSLKNHGELEPLVSGEFGAAVHSLQLGEYTIIGEVGRGGMGIVYEAQHNALNRRVALKLLPIASMLDPRQIARFKNESNAAAQLQHPHIVPVFNVGVEKGIHYYAMQFIDGRTIESVIASQDEAKQTSNYRNAISQAARVADAIHCAHECGIIHRDIKPSNLILDKSGKVWVTDFGLARCQNHHSLTVSGDVIGTMRYMSPEQAAGQMARVDHRTDIYSLGATLYEMLTGVSAIAGEDSPSVLSEIANAPTPKSRRLRPELPPAIDVVLHKAMAKNKDDRYSTALEFASDLQAILEQRPTMAKPPSKTWRVKQWTSRHRKLVLATSLILLFGIFGMLTALVIIANKNQELRFSKQAADRNFRKAQEAVGTLGLAVSADLASIPGTEHIRQSVLKNTLKHYKDFVQESRGNRKLLSELALTQSRIGTLILDLESPQAAIPNLNDSENSYRALLREKPGSIEALQGRARNLNQMGLAHAANGNSDAAKRCYDHAIRIQQNLSTEVSDVKHRIDLALSQSNLGLLMINSGSTDEAETTLRQSIASLSEVVQQNPSHVLANRGLAAALTNLSYLTVDAAPDHATALLEEAIGCQLRIHKSAPSQLKASSEIANTYNTLGAAKLSENSVSEAIDAFSHAIELHRKMHEIAPSVNSYQIDLATSLNNIASARFRQGQYTPAIRAAHEAINLQMTCLKRGPKDPASFKRLAVMHSNLAAALAELDRIADAVHAYQHAIAYQNQLLETNPMDAANRTNLMHIYAALLRYQLKTKQWSDAKNTITSYRQAAEISPEHLIPVARNIAEIATVFPASGQQKLFTTHIASLFASAKQQGVAIDPTIMEDDSFLNFKDDKRIRRMVQQ
jgi:eukaryotic-like serine/threonine-protein kinase